MVHPCNRILLSNEKELPIHTITCMILKSICSVKEATHKCYILLDFTYIVFWKKQNHRDRNQVSGCQRLEVEGGIDYQGTQMSYLGLRVMFYIVAIFVVP